MPSPSSVVPALAAVLTLGAAVLQTSPAVADTITDKYTTPGSYSLTIPEGATSVNVIANGAAGNDGASSAANGSPGGTGGRGAEVNANVPISPGGLFAPGDTLQVYVGAQGAGAHGGSGDGLAGPGGNGGGLAIVTNTSANGALLAVAGGGGGGGGGGAAFAGLPGGAGGEGPGTSGNGGVGTGIPSALGGGTGSTGSCSTPTFGGIGGTAANASASGGGGGGGNGMSGGGSGNAGPSGGGGGGGGSGGSVIASLGTGTIGIDAFPGNGSIILTFTRTLVAPQFTTGNSLTVPAIATQVDFVAFHAHATAVPAPTYALLGEPSWLSIDPTTGDLSGGIPPRTTGKFTFQITANNFVTPTAFQTFTLNVVAAPVTVGGSAALTGNVTNPVSSRFTAAGGIGPYTWSKTSGSLPAGLTLDSTGRLSGTPTATGTSTFTVKATDSAIPTAGSGTRSITMTINPRQLTVTSKSLAAGTVGKTYSQAVSSAMGIKPLRWSISGGSLPPGLSLDPSSGVISGTPIQPGTSSFTVKVTDATTPTPMSTTASLTLIVNPGVMPAVYVTNGGNSAVNAFPLLTGGNIAPSRAITGSLTTLNGTTAVTIDSNGTVDVASANTPAIAEFGYGVSGNATPSAVLSGSDTGLTLPYGLALDSARRLYVANYTSAAITVYSPGASGDAAPVAVISGDKTGLNGPTALTFDKAGHLWVANLGSNSLTEYPSGANGNVPALATIAGPSTAINGPQGLVLDGAGKLLVSNTYGASLTEYPVTASGDTAPARTITGSATGLAFPHAVDVDATGNIYVANELAGLTEYAPSASGNVAPVFSVGGTNTGLRGPDGIAVAPPLSVRTAKLKAARVGHRYRVRLRANLGTTPYRWSIKHGKLPRGLHLKRSGTLTGRPRHRGTYHFTVRVRDASHPAMRANQALVLRVR